MHGKTSPVTHTGVGVFSGLPSPYTVTRYHSLAIERASLPECLEMTAWTQNEDGSVDEIMGIRHRELDIQGVQYHPESILTEHGRDLLRNFIDIPASYCRRSGRDGELAARGAVYPFKSREDGGAMMSWTRERYRA